MSKDIIEVIRESARNLGVEKSDGIVPESKLGELGLDSLGIFTIVSDVEEEFGVEIPQEEFETLETIDDLKAAVSRKVG